MRLQRSIDRIPVAVQSESLEEFQLLVGVILTEAVFQAGERACPERSRRDLARRPATIKGEQRPRTISEVTSLNVIRWIFFNIMGEARDRGSFSGPALNSVETGCSGRRH